MIGELFFKSGFTTTLVTSFVIIKFIFFVITNFLTENFNQEFRYF